MPLSDVMGQEKAVGILRGILSRRAVAHCYIFTGEEGVGKNLAARFFSQAILCGRGGEAGKEACGSCSSCLKVEAGNHPDLLVVERDGAMIKIGQITPRSDAKADDPVSVEEFLSKTSVMGGSKVVIVREAERMNAEAGNAFLKTLEEPPPNSVIILLSARPDLLPETILSRAQRVRFRPIPPSEIARGASLRGLDRPDLRAALSGGRLDRALDPDLIRDRDLFLTGLADALTGRKDVDDLWKDREAMEEWLGQAASWFRDVLVYKIAPDPRLLVHTDRQEEIRRIAGTASAERCLDRLREVVRMRDILRFNPNKAIGFQYLMLKLTDGTV